jgi:hypothetical protein
MGELRALLVVRNQWHVYVLVNLRGEAQGPERMRDFELVFFINLVGVATA